MRLRTLRQTMDRRNLLRSAAAGLAFAALFGGAMSRAVGRARELRITRILLQVAEGRRLTPVAPNAQGPYPWGDATSEPVLRLQTAQGLEGIGYYVGSPEQLRPLLGRDPFDLFEWDGDTVHGPAEQNASLVAGLAGADAALFDLLGKAIGRPIADLLGPRVRDAVPVYNSSLYMEEFLPSSEWPGLAYLQGGPAPYDPAEMVARKAAWLLSQPEGIRILKIKIGRAKWMASFDAALERDIAVVQAVRRAVGSEATLLVDANDGYVPRPLAAAEFAEATAAENLYWMEEMFDEERAADTRELKRRLRAAKLPIKLADGETHHGGIPPELLAARFAAPGAPEEPLFDIDQPDMNANGFLRVQAIARACAGHRVTVSPHNFGSKLGLYAQAHLGLVTPNWAFCEADDSTFPALRADGIRIENGRVRLTGLPGLGVVLDEAALERPTLVLEL